MQQKDWKKIKEIFNEVADLPRVKRQEFLHKEFNGNDEMRLEVERMTPAYASPEQIRGRRIGTPSDTDFSQKFF